MTQHSEQPTNGYSKGRSYAYSGGDSSLEKGHGDGVADGGADCSIPSNFDGRDLNSYDHKGTKSYEPTTKP